MKQKPLRPKSVEQDQQLKTKSVHFKSNMSEMEHSSSFGFKANFKVYFKKINFKML